MSKRSYGMTAVPKAKQLLIALVLSVGLTLGLFEIPIAFRSGIGSTTTLNGVLWFGNGANTDGAGLLSVTNEYTRDPAFAADGYHLTAGSAAIDRGESTGVTIDIDGEPRTMPPDLGTDEYANANLQGCDSYPIALHVSSLEGLAPGDLLAKIHNGTASGNFGWLRWTDDSDTIPANTNSEAYLAEELSNPHLAVIDYREPEHRDPDDTSLNAGDWVWAMTGTVSSNSVAKTELERLRSEETEMRVPVWDVAESTGSSAVYHIVGFAQVRLDDYDLTSNPKQISVTFLGWDNDACLEIHPDLVIDKSANQATVRSGNTLTYTLTFSNTGPALATGVVISDVLPSILTDLSVTCSGADITPTAGVTYAWEVQDLAMNQGGIITISGQLGASPVEDMVTNTATIAGTGVETDTTNNSSNTVVLFEAEAVYLPLIFK